jgi:uncharacterized membrane protein
LAALKGEMRESNMRRIRFGVPDVLFIFGVMIAAYIFYEDYVKIAISAGILGGIFAYYKYIRNE